MKKKKVFGIIGEQAGGKGAAANMIIRHFGGTRFTTSNILRRTLDSLYLPATRDNLINLALHLKKCFGDDVLMKTMLKDVENDDSELTIVDGIRMPGDPETFRNAYGDQFKLIFVTADPKIRYARSVQRGEKVGESEQSFADFLSKESLETEKYIKEVGKTADFTINNSGTEKELEKQVMQIMEKI